MTRIGKTLVSYLDMKYFKEAFFAFMMYSPGAQKLGFTDGKDQYHYIQFAKKMQGLTDKPQGHVQANRNENFIGVINIVDNSMDMLFESLSPAGQKMFWAVWQDALEKQQKFIDTIVKGRSGAGGKIPVDGETIAQHAGHQFDRNMITTLHSHSLYSGYTLTADGNLYSITEKMFHTHRTRLDNIFQVGMAHGIENNFGVRVGLDPGTKQAYVHGFSRHREPIRNDAAEKYLEDHGIKKTRLSMVYARQNTREKKGEHTQEAYEKTRGKKTGEPEPVVGKSTWGEVLNEYIIQPLAVVKAAWSRRKNGEVVRVRDVEKFMTDVRKTSRRKCHKAAIRAIRRERCESFIDALKVAEAAFKAARKPRLVLQKGTRVNVDASAIKSDKQFEELDRLVKAKGCHLHVIGKRVTEEKKQEQQQSQGMKR